MPQNYCPALLPERSTAQHLRRWRCGRRGIACRLCKHSCAHATERRAEKNGPVAAPLGREARTQGGERQAEAARQRWLHRRPAPVPAAASAAANAPASSALSTEVITQPSLSLCGACWCANHDSSVASAGSTPSDNEASGGGGGGRGGGGDPAEAPPVPPTPSSAENTVLAGAPEMEGDAAEAKRGGELKGITRRGK